MRRLKKTKKNYKLLTALRAIGFIGVTLFHRFSHVFPGGYLAVIIFLVLSGFMTMRASDIRDKNKRYYPIRDFIRKFINILSPVYFIMAVSLLVALFFAREIFDDSIKSVVPVALNFENYAKIINKEDYFNQLGNFNILNHMWYVSIYMQMILVFTILSELTKKLSDNSKIAIYLALTGISFLLISVLGKTSADITRIYNGIDTRFSAFSLGASLYLINKKIRSGFRFNKNFLRLSIGILLILVIIPFIFVNGREIGSYKAIFIIYTVIIGLLVTSLYNVEDIYPDKIKRIPVLTYLGERSYHLYLWQYVVQVFSVYFLHSTPLLVQIVIELILIIILSEITYQLFRNKDLNIILLILSAITLTGLSIVSITIGNAKEKEIEDLRKEITANEDMIKKRNEEAKIANSRKIKDTKVPELGTTIVVGKKDDIDNSKTEIIEDNNFVEKAYDDFNFTENELNYLSNLSITSVGDSVIINADSYIRKFVPNFYLDGEVGRDMIHGPSILSSIKENVGLGDIVLISLGSNGSANISDMEEIMNIAGDRDVYFVNTSHTQSYMDYVNRNIKEFCKTHDRAHLVDWREYIKDKPDYLAADRTHPNVPGSDGFAKLIMRKILNVNKIK